MPGVASSSPGVPTYAKRPASRTTTSPWAAREERGDANHLRMAVGPARGRPLKKKSVPTFLGRREKLPGIAQLMPNGVLGLSGANVVPTAKEKESQCPRNPGLESVSRSNTEARVAMF